MPQPPSHTVSTTLQPARWDTNGKAKGKARAHSSSSSDMEHKNVSSSWPSYAISTNFTNGNSVEDALSDDDIARPISRASSSDSLTSGENDNDSWSRGQSPSGRFRERKRSHKPPKFRVIRQPKTNNTRSGESVNPGGANFGDPKVKDLQPIPSPPWAKSKPLPVGHGERDTLNNEPSSFSAVSKSGHSNMAASGSTFVAQPSSQLKLNATPLSSSSHQSPTRMDQAGPSSKSRYAWAAPQIARPQPNSGAKPTLFKWVHANPPDTNQSTRPASYIYPKVESSKDAHDQAGGRQMQRRQPPNLDYQPPENSIKAATTHEQSSEQFTPRSRSNSDIVLSAPPDTRNTGPRPFGRRTLQQRSNFILQDYAVSGGRTIIGTKSNGQPIFRSHSFASQVTYPAVPPDMRDQSREQSNLPIPTPNPPTSPKAGQKRRHESGDEIDDLNRKRSGTTEDIEMGEPTKISKTEPTMSPNTEMRDQPTRSGSISSRTGHPRPRPGRLHWMPPEVAPNQPKASSSSPKTITLTAYPHPAAQRNYEPRHFSGAPPAPTPSPPPASSGPHHIGHHFPASYRPTRVEDARPPHNRYAYPPPPAAHYGHPGYPPPPPRHYAPSAPPRGPGVPLPPLPPQYAYPPDREHLYEAHWRGRSPYDVHRSSSRQRSPHQHYPYHDARLVDYPPPPPPLPQHHRHQPSASPPPQRYLPRYPPRPYDRQPYGHPENSYERQPIPRGRPLVRSPSPAHRALPLSPRAPLSKLPRSRSASPPRDLSNGMVKTPAPLTVGDVGSKNAHELNLVEIPPSHINGPPASVRLPLSGEYEQHPLRQQTSYLPMNAVGGAQFVLKPPKQPKTKSVKPKTQSSSEGKPEKPKEPVLKFKEMTGKEREGKRPRRRMKNRLQSEQMMMTTGHMFVSHVVEATPIFTGPEMDSTNGSRPRPTHSSSASTSTSREAGTVYSADSPLDLTRDSPVPEDTAEPLPARRSRSPLFISTSLMLGSRSRYGSRGRRDDSHMLNRSPSPMEVTHREPSVNASVGPKELPETRIISLDVLMDSDPPTPPFRRPPFSPSLSVDSLDCIGPRNPTEDAREEMMMRDDGEAESEPNGSEKNARAKPLPKAKKFPCDVCGQIFTRSGDVKRHKDSRHGEGSANCVCPYCGKVLTRQDALQRHWDKYCHKASRRKVHGYQMRVDLSDDSLDEYEDAIDSRPILLGPAPNGMSRREVEEDEAALGGSSGVDVRPYRAAPPATALHPVAGSDSTDRKKGKAKQKTRARRKIPNQGARTLDGDEAEEDELESEDPLNEWADKDFRKKKVASTIITPTADEDEDEEVDQLDESDNEQPAPLNYKTHTLTRKDHHPNQMDMNSAHSSHGTSNLTALLVNGSSKPNGSFGSKKYFRLSSSQPPYHLAAHGSQDVQMTYDGDQRSSPTPQLPTDPYTNSFRPQSAEFQRRHSPSSESASRSPSIPTPTSVHSSGEPLLTFQHITDFTPKSPKPRRTIKLDAEMDSSETAALGGQIRMRVVPQSTVIIPAQPALAIMHEYPHVEKKKGKRNEGLVPDYGFVPREYVYREKE